MAFSFDLHVLGINRMLQHWYQWIFVGILGISIMAAVAYTFWLIFATLFEQIKKRRFIVPPADTKEYIQKLSETIPRFRPNRKILKKPKSFGVYCGEVSHPPTADQIRVLMEWEMLLVDPLQPGITDALLYMNRLEGYVIGRIDVAALTAAMPETERVAKVKAVTDAIIKNMCPNGESPSPYDGVLIANWDESITPGICNEIIGFLNSVNLNVYNEITGPRFMDSLNSNINVSQLAGMVFINGSILPNGERRDYFDLLCMKSAIEIVTAQSCLREFAVVMCEIIDDDAQLTNAVVKRSSNWCSYYGAVTWIGNKSALTDATLNFPVNTPDSAFEWLKREKVMDLHETWRLNAKISDEPVCDKSIYTALEHILPGISGAVELYAADYTVSTSDEQLIDVHPIDWVSKVVYRTVDPLSTSSRGAQYSGLGCFPIGMHVEQSEFDTLVHSQTRLLKLNLLHKVKSEELKQMGQKIRRLIDSPTWFGSPNDFVIIQELVHALSGESQTTAVEVYIALDSGFRNLDYTSQFWGVYDGDDDVTRIFITRNAKDLTGTVLHTYMSSRRCARLTCFEAEDALAKALGEINDLTPLPARMLQDIELLTPLETLLFLQGVAIAGNYNGLLWRIRKRCEYELIDVSSSAQLKYLNTVSYLRGDITVEDLITKRIQWYRQNQIAQLPRVEDAIKLFNTVDKAINNFLKYNIRDHATAFIETLDTIMKPGKIDVRADILGLSIFCNFRRYAFDELYLDATDRCPLFNPQPDQMAVFAEMWGLGSHCEAYFDVTPKALGRILYHRYRTYYNKHQPPFEADSRTQLASSYMSAGTDIDREGITDFKKGWKSKLKNTSYLGVFAVPALIDILLLTTTGRGLYLSAFMSPVEQQMSTYALVIALLLCGAVSSCIGTGGSFYLYAMVYPTMNMFMVTRLVAGVVLVSIAAAIASVILLALQMYQAAAIFFLYLMVFTIYLFTLAVLSTMQFPGSPLPSGRTAIGQALCVLIIGPILTSYIHGHDAVIYLSTLWGFAFIFLWRARHVISSWNTWLLNLPSNTDQEVLDWYLKTYHNGDICAFDGMTAPAAAQVSRTALFKAVMAEREKPFWAKPTTDENVRKLADAYQTTVFLLDWYCQFMQASKPLPYTSTWNLQVNVAVNTIRNTDKGLRLHNGFIHWRYASPEIACGVLYFLLALLDRWIELICGGKLIGIAVIGNNDSRVSIGLALVYYLFAAVILDIVAAPLYEAVGNTSQERIRSTEHLNDVAKSDARNKRNLYWGSLAKFVCLQVWGLAFSTSFVWVYVEEQNAAILYFAYTAAYTGLLWFQYNKVFTGASALGPMAFAVFVGFAVGIPLRVLRPDIFWNDVLGLAAGTWTAGYLTLRLVNLGGTQVEELDEKKSFAHSQKAIGPKSDITNESLSQLFDDLDNLPISEKLAITSQSTIARKVLQILSNAKQSPKALEIMAAFPHAFALLDHIIVSWNTGETIVEGVSLDHMVGQKYDICAVSCKVDRRLKVYVGMDLRGTKDWMTNFELNCYTIAEAVVHETCEVGLGLSHSDSVLAELLISQNEELQLPERIAQQLESSSTKELFEILNRRDHELVQHLALQTDCDRDWESLPNDIRVVLVKRTCGETYEINESQLKWLQTNRCDQRVPYEVYLARRDLHAYLTLLIDEYATSLLRDPIQRTVPTRREVVDDLFSEAKREVAPSNSRYGVIGHLLRPVVAVKRWLRTFVKFLFIVLIADPEFQREMAYLLTGSWLRVPVMFLATRIWIYSRFLQEQVVPLFMFYNRPHIKKLAKFMKSGVVTVMYKNKLVINNLKSPSTAFIEVQRDGNVKLWQYSGEHSKKPEDDSQLLSINQYSKNLALIGRQEFVKGRMVNDFYYEYDTRGRSNLSRKSRMPTSRYCVTGEREGERIYYSRKGFIKSGTAVRNGVPYEFKYEYRRKAKFDDGLLRVKYTFNPRSSFPLNAHVWFCVPPIRYADQPNRWIPYSKVTQAEFRQGGNVYDTKWAYDHKCHPTLSTLLNGIEEPTPDMILHDHFLVLSKPTSTSFVHEDPLLPFNSLSAGFFRRMFNLHKKSTPVSTTRARTFLWKSWKDSTNIDGVTARWLDEMALRADPIVKPYWKARDSGRIHQAIKYLRGNGDAIMASADVDHEVSAWTSLAYKMSDLFSLGQGGDTSINTRTAINQINDRQDRLHVLATDTGTWPTEGGGVSCCRRDMVNNLQNIKWHLVAEVANDYSIPRFQIEQNVQSLKILPLWGLDFMTPTHGIFENQLDTAMDEKLIATNDADIREKFLPILCSLVRGARALEFNPTNVAEYTKMLVHLNEYFENRNWGAVWNSSIVKYKWRELWLSKNMENTFPIQKWFDVEKPTIPQLDAGLELYQRYLFIFSIPVPDQLPTVFQATHHQIGAAYGILCKIKRHCTFQIWDHSIIWRETNSYMSSAQCTHPPFVRNSLCGLMRLAAQLNMYHADVILPCTNYFNPGWEIEIGSCEGLLMHRKKFSRKIDPVVNGICNMESFDPFEKIKTEKPTVTMLSHVQYVKDVKNALLAADVIVNEWGFKDYRLDVYGGLDRTPSYTVECQEIIASKSLRGYVTLKGYGNPQAVLADTWVFMNSSISEGLPLAIGEAALTGAPIVCTDVGATFQVLTDPDNPKQRYGTVIAPNDHRALARAQISLLAVMDEWEEYGEDTTPFGPFPEHPTPEDVARITKRMYDKTPQRRNLGLQLRKIVQKSFSGDRYLREHEQMLWVGKHRNEAKHKSLAAENNETIIEMLDDVDNAIEIEEFRPTILRGVSGYSAYDASLSSARRSSIPSERTSFTDDGQRSIHYYDVQRPGSAADHWRDVSKDLEKLKRFQTIESDIDEESAV